MMLANMAQWAAIFGLGRSDDDEDGGGMFGMLVMAFLAPLAATIIQMAISRTREFAADRTGAAMSGDPLGLAAALSKLGLAAERIPMDASPQTSHFFIVNPLSGQSVARFFSTHRAARRAHCAPAGTGQVATAADQIGRGRRRVPGQRGRPAGRLSYLIARGLSGLPTALGICGGGATHRNSSSRLGRVALKLDPAPARVPGYLVGYR